MVRLFIFLAAAQLVLFMLALISVLSADRVRNAPRFAWVLLIVLVPLLGPVAYFLAGRPTASPRKGAPVRRDRSRPAAPDDDPDFLRSMDSEQSRRDREFLAQWEKEFNRNNNQDDENA
jgi:Phospholipase_D-nuclease N-terminal